MARILFWNVNNGDLTSFVCAIASSKNADIDILHENTVASGVTLGALRREVSTEFYVPNFTSEKRFHCFCRNVRFDMAEVHAGFRTSTRSLKIGRKRVLLALLHGVDPRNYDSESRQSFAQSLATEMRFVKEQYKTNRLVILGDFNMNPYDRGMNLAAGFNAMMTRKCASPGLRRHIDVDYELYYNPMWSLFGDNTEGPAGTVYDANNQGPYGWSMFDQVVINHSIMHLFEKVEILTHAGPFPLMNNKGRPNAEQASDHFPILVTLKEEYNE